MANRSTDAVPSPRDAGLFLAVRKSVLRDEGEIDGLDANRVQTGIIVVQPAAAACFNAGRPIGTFGVADRLGGGPAPAYACADHGLGAKALKPIS